MEKFEIIYKKNFSGIYTFLYRLCNDKSLAEELTQETFFQAFKSFGKFRHESELFTWLASIAKYCFFSYLRKNKNQSECVNIDLIAGIICEDYKNGPEENLQKKDISQKIKQSIQKMPQKYKDVVMLRLYAELPFSQIAASLNISENSAKVIFHRAKITIREELKNENYL